MKTCFFALSVENSKSYVLVHLQGFITVISFSQSDANIFEGKILLFVQQGQMNFFDKITIVRFFLDIPLYLTVF